jgi:hypothetical protein
MVLSLARRANEHVLMSTFCDSPLSVEQAS